MPNCPHCGCSLDDLVADELDQVVNKPEADGSGPTLQTIVDRLAQKAAKKRHAAADGYSPRDYVG